MEDKRWNGDDRPEFGNDKEYVWYHIENDEIMVGADRVYLIFCSDYIFLGEL